MKVLRSEDLEAKGIRPDTASELILKNKVLQRAHEFGKHERQAALVAGERAENTGVFCILVENATSLTLWCEPAKSEPSAPRATAVYNPRSGHTAPNVLRNPFFPPSRETHP
ncbi:MAG: hypothetical protein HC921_08335 [Synechococcaceae cyanobacterium SM2_3_1]|nr:hypothetical protein [Synechococcaceae cyanobacterium SM2_3_1]